jgi:hypothetical protein
MPKAVICIATTEEQAAHFTDQLKDAGLSGNGVSVLLPDRAGARDFAHDLHHSKAPEGAAIGAIAGGIAAGLLGLIGIRTVAVPGVGLTMSASGRAATGSAVGEIAAAAAYFGIPEDKATHYEGMAVESDDALISVHSEESEEHKSAAPYCEWCRNARRRKSLMARTPATPRTLARPRSGNLRMRIT